MLAVALGDAGGDVPLSAGLLGGRVGRRRARHGPRSTRPRRQAARRVRFVAGRSSAFNVTRVFVDGEGATATSEDGGDGGKVLVAGGVNKGGSRAANRGGLRGTRGALAGRVAYVGRGDDAAVTSGARAHAAVLATCSRHASDCGRGLGGVGTTPPAEAEDRSRGDYES